ncbi:probable WRKY transcription factor 40 [Zingiber officinale]|uniref:WRKY domain-containing protein n=1 Tax=Zingiber officinale TaxID=94328 RepID=A0A8J5HQC9_ZINOF|nr:probable WRKY transcription factor 40 [Zingiber officinale]KAG6521342.1 hypothetical protein ZIOFF_018457 [Zingiber officinale]
MDHEWTNPSTLNLDLNIGQSTDFISAGGLKTKLNELNQEKKRLINIIEEIHTARAASHGQLMDITSLPLAESSFSMARKRKMESTEMNTCNGGSSVDRILGVRDQSKIDLCGHSCKRFREDGKPYARTTYTIVDASDSSLMVRDGYQWRKYGQKVTKDNPSPRAYFRCSYAPSCSAKKKVQRSAKVKTVLVATYKGEHNHCRPSPIGITGAMHEDASHPYFLSPTSSDLTITLDLKRQGLYSNVHDKDTELVEFQRVVVEKMASSLTKDPNFTAALASAISGRIQHMQVQN